jgi:hypothetical protein
VHSFPAPLGPMLRSAGPPGLPSCSEPLYGAARGLLASLAFTNPVPTAAPAATPHLYLRQVPDPELADYR